MLIKKYDFITKIIIKIAQKLKDNLPDEDYGFEMWKRTKEILKEFFGD